MLMVETLNNLTKCTFTNNFNQLKSEGNVISLLNPVVALLIIEAIVDQSFHVARLYLVFVFTDVE